MGEYADCIIYGSMCACGKYLGSQPGYPRYCSEQCARDYGGSEEKQTKTKALTWKCPHCPKKFGSAKGCDDHVRAKHGDQIGTA